MTDGHDRVTNGHDQTWTGSEGDPAPDSEALVEDIEQTRGAMTETVQAIGDRLSPANIVADAKATVREATVGKVEEMADTAGRVLEDAGYTAQNAGGSIVETIRRNPLPAAMAAVGIGWLMTHKAKGQTRYDSRYDSRRSDAYGSWATDRAYGGQHDGGPRQALAEIGDTVGERAGDVGETLRQVPQDVRYRAEGIGQQAGRLMEESPLVAGAVAVAVGAVVGSLLPSTDVEQRVLGPATERAIDTAEQAATEKLAELDTDSSMSTRGSMS